MTKLEEWFFKRIVKREVRQGFHHDARIIDLYRTIRDACETEFSEDNAVTLNSNLTEWFEASLKSK